VIAPLKCVPVIAPNQSDPIYPDLKGMATSLPNNLDQRFWHRRFFHGCSPDTKPYS